MSVEVLQFELYCYRTYCAIVLKIAGRRNFSISGPQIGCIDTDILSHFLLLFSCWWWNSGDELCIDLNILALQELQFDKYVM